MDNQKYSNRAILGFVLSLIFMIPLVSIIGFIISIIALKEIKKSRESGRGLAIAGIIIGAVFGIVQVIALIGFLLIFIYAATQV